MTTPPAATHNKTMVIPGGKSMYQLYYLVTKIIYFLSLQLKNNSNCLNSLNSALQGVSQFTPLCFHLGLKSYDGV